ncbi:hypothetical protein ADL34_32355 [Streptomyces sp. NRRL WC-3605]|nr:hypothetical protein ADL33_32770 [Streptomyces sp. NRRL WC-3604]KUL68777.1 hypothetical protein ADL34_32355 [Streptomyces sp. NRRL WC-3605]
MGAQVGQHGGELPTGPGSSCLGGTRGIFGIITEVIPVFSRKPVFGYFGLIGATVAITGLSAIVWAHHMFATGAVLLPFFSLASFLIAVPTGVKFFNWIGTMWRGALSFETPMLWALGFLATFLFGGLTGVLLASPPLDFHTTDTYFVVAHLHYVLFGTVVFAMFAGFASASVLEGCGDGLRVQSSAPPASGLDRPPVRRSPPPRVLAGP